MEIVDAYAHCGLSKYEPVEKVREVLDAAGVSRAVLVQHLGEFDNSYIGGIAARDPDRFAGVCLVDQTSAGACDALRELADTGHFKGVRLTADTCTSAPLLLATAADLGLIIVLYAPDGVGGSVPTLRKFLDSHPEARMVLTHLGNPRLADAPDFVTYREVYRLAEHPGVYYQVSGMKMFCPFPHEPLHDLIAEAVAHFGTDRLCWGSNYPVVGTAGDYKQDLSNLLEGRLPIPQEAISQVAGGNARKLWFA